MSIQQMKAPDSRHTDLGSLDIAKTNADFINQSYNLLEFFAFERHQGTIRHPVIFTFLA
ncbi:hypothetical protein D3C81_1053970 [compost metagenome]